MQFNGFSNADFEAYQQRKWGSNVFNLERLVVKQKLEALGRLLAPRLHAADGAPLAHEVNAEHPAVWNHRRVESQYLFFSRNADARRELDTIISRSRSMASLVEDPSPLRNHIFLSVMIDEHGVEVAVKLHADATVDRENAERLAADFFAREKLRARLHALPEGYQIGGYELSGEFWRECSSLSDDDLSALIAALADSDSWLTVRRSWPRDAATSAGEAFAEQLAVGLEGLLPVLHTLAWSRDNDHLAMRDTLRAVDRQKKDKGLSKNDHVRIVSGMLSGKTGIVQEASGKGEVKVLIGTLTIKLNSDALAKI